MRRPVYDYAHLDRPFGEVGTVLRGHPEVWLPHPASPEGEGWTVDLEADGLVPAPLATVRAIVTVRELLPQTSETVLVRPVAWRAADAASLFPTFEGELELAALGTRLCQLSLLGSYRPPLSVLGDAGDALFGRRVAELVVRRFVLAVGERIREATLAA